MRQVSSFPRPPLERLAQRICKAVSARDMSDSGMVIASFKQRSRIAVVGAAIQLAIVELAVVELAIAKQ